MRPPPSTRRCRLNDPNVSDGTLWGSAASFLVAVRLRHCAGGRSGSSMGDRDRAPGLPRAADRRSARVRPRPCSTAGVDAVEILAGGLCLARAFTKPQGTDAFPWCSAPRYCRGRSGDVVLTIESLGGDTPPTPSLADVFYIAFFPLAYVAIVLFMRGEVRRMNSPSWLDSAVAGLGAASVCAAFAFHGVLSAHRRWRARSCHEPCLPRRGPSAPDLVVGQHGDARQAGKGHHGCCSPRAWP